MATVLPSEAALEEYLERDASLLGERLLVIGRQVRTPYGKLIDLLAMDADGNLHVLELKRDRTPRDVVAQVLDYGSWVSSLGREAVIELASEHLRASLEGAFEDAFGDSLPDELNAQIRMTIVATDLDASSERIVTYLREFGVPVNVVFFAYLEDEERRYLARSWLASETDVASGGAARPGRGGGKRAEWNGRDWFVAFGDGEHRLWTDARKHGFIAAGGGDWYSRTLRSLPVGARVNVLIPGRGYVGVGEVLAPARPFAEAEVMHEGEWKPLDRPGVQLEGSYYHSGARETEVAGDAEYIVPVRWIATRAADDAFWVKGMFANQNSACKLRQEFTLEKLAEHFQLDDE